MRHSIIGEVYHSLDKNELKKLTKYLKTSQWSRSETIIKSHECLSQFSLKNQLEDLEKEVLFASIYDGEPYTDNKLRFALSRLLEAVKEFILLEENEKKNVHTEKVWMDFIQAKRLKKNILYNIESKQTPQNTHEKFINNYFKSNLAAIYHFQFSSEVDLRFNALLDIVKTAEIFSDYVFIRQYCLILTFSNIFKSADFQIANTRYNEIKEKNWNQEIPEFDVYIALIELLINNTVENYYLYKEKFFRLFDTYEDEDKVTLISYLLNFSTAQINKGNVGFIDEQYNLFNLFEEQNVFHIKNYINITRINNVIHIYLRKKEYEKAESFIFKYSKYLNEEIEESCKHFNIARIRFEKKMYKESLRELLQVDFGREAFYAINSKYLLLKNYYELRESDPLNSLCNSFKEYVKKNKIISDLYKTNSLNFIKMVDKIYSATPNKAKKIESELLSMSQIAEKNWLLEKVREKIT